MPRFQYTSRVIRGRNELGLYFIVAMVTYITPPTSDSFYFTWYLQPESFSSIFLLCPQLSAFPVCLYVREGLSPCSSLSSSRRVLLHVSRYVLAWFGVVGRRKWYFLLFWSSLISKQALSPCLSGQEFLNGPDSSLQVEVFSFSPPHSQSWSLPMRSGRNGLLVFPQRL